jgi:tetratricopeptide (TPR) repeat protein
VYETAVQDRVRGPAPTVPPSPTFLPASVAGVEVIESRQRLATQLSRELLADSLRPLADAPTAIEPPTGWKNIESELRERLARSRELLRRQAILSAREEVLAGLRGLTRAIDLRTSAYSSEPALNRALMALDEELDFHQSLRQPTHSISTRQIVARHETPALKGVELEDVSPELAAQHYRTYAREQFQLAAQEHPWAADLFFALGKTYECQASDAQPDSRVWRHQAMTCYIAALDVSPEHAEGAQQLGYVLMLLDRLEEAETALQLAIAKKPTLTAWDNLAEVYRRRGDPQQASLAANQANALRTSSSGSTIPDVVSLDPRAFAGISPNQVIGSTSFREATTATPSAAVAKDTATKTSWLSRLWR